MISMQPCLHGGHCPHDSTARKRDSSPGHADHVGGVVVDDEAGGAEARARAAKSSYVSGTSKSAAGSTGSTRPDNAASSGDPSGGPPQRVEQLGERRAELDLVDTGAADVADDGGDDRAGRPRRAHRAEPVGALGQHVGGGGQRLDVVDRRSGCSRPGCDRLGFPAARRRGGEQAVLPRRQQPGQRVAPLDHLEQRLLLAEQVLVGSLDDGDGEVAEQARLAELDAARRRSATSPAYERFVAT